MRKRERENPCGICGHYHKYEEGEVCGICGHRMPVGVEKSLIQISAFPSEILPEFLYLGSYDNASRSELLKTLGISRVLNTVPACQNLYKNSFTYHCLPDSPTLAFDDAVEFLEQCEQDKARVLVHCMSGKNRSPAVVMAYLVKSRKWTLDQSYQWVKEHRPHVDINPGVMQQLQEYAQKIQAALESSGGSGAAPSISGGGAPFSFGFTNPTNVPLALPAFNTTATPFIIARADIPSPNEFTFGAAADAHQNLVSSAPSSVNPNATDVSMDGS